MRLQKAVAKLGRIRGLAGLADTVGAVDRLSDMPPIRDNPGKLRGRYYLPDGLAEGAPLVVVLHGCTQDAAGYDHGSGWSRLADRHRFALLFPEQDRANNPNLCFNWFTAGDSRRGTGEPASIAAMIEWAVTEHGIDRGRIYVTGLSAGGAMASVMLATYPELFAGGAIIAGIAYGCASGVAEAFDCMAGRAQSDAAALAQSVRRASPHKGPWPRISVWQGTADHTVVPSNADAIVLQWSQLHGLPPKPSRTESVDGFPRRVWTGPGGEELIEQYVVTGMAHGTPLMPGTGEGESGKAGAHMLDVGLSSTDRIAAFWRIAPPAKEGKRSKAKAEAPSPRSEPNLQAEPKRQAEPAAGSGVQKVIEDALKAAGLMK